MTLCLLVNNKYNTNALNLANELLVVMNITMSYDFMDVVHVTFCFAGDWNEPSVHGSMFLDPITVAKFSGIIGY